MAFKRAASTNRWAHRRLLISPHFHDPQLGKDVTELQKAVNREAKARGLGQLKVDGACGRATVAKARQVAHALGIGLRGPGVSIYVQHLIRHPGLRTPIQKARGQRWQADPTHHPLIVRGNKVQGGRPRDRVVAAAMMAAHLFYEGKSHRFYSQAGRWTVNHGITGEAPGDRSDCSQFDTAICHAAGVQDPNANGYKGGYTGTLPHGGRYVSRAELEPGDDVVYGPYPHHHVEKFVGPGNRTVGHGSPPVDYGDIYMMAGPQFIHYDFKDVA